MPKGSLSRVEYTHWRKQAFWISRQLAPAHLVEDAVGSCMESLVVALRKFDPAKNDNLGNYVLQRFRWAVLDAMRAHRPETRSDTARGMFFSNVPLDEHAAALPSTLPAVDLDGIDLAKAIEQLPPKSRAFVLAYLRLGDVAAAAAELGISTNCGAQRLFQAVRALRKLMA
jgi:RNA polymerase sigma factor (sigma-70 family)